MAQRPVFIPQISGSSFVNVENIDFQWHAGLILSQKRKSIASLHSSARHACGVSQLLDVSTKSPDGIGNSLSAFNLMLDIPSLERSISVECIYQASKVFEMGGPFVDILQMTSLEAKTDERLISSGNLTGFRFLSIDWALEPRTAFYDWIYVSALYRQTDLILQIEKFDGFTDIEFNPKKSINCQAYSVALFLSLRRRGVLDDAISSSEAFLQCVGSVRDTREQVQLF